MKVAGVRRLSPWTLFAAALALALAASALQAASRPVRVMTRNLYFGADLTPAMLASDAQGLAVAGTQIWTTAEASDFPGRALALAFEIADAEPDLVAVQEAAIWRTGPPDGPPQLGGTPAADVIHDSLELLLAALHDLGADYDVVLVQDEADLESITTLGHDIRLTWRDAILARRSGVESGEIRWTGLQAAHFPDDLLLHVPLLGGLVSVESTRGYLAADVTVNRRSFRFIATHLEAFSAGYRALQAVYLAGVALGAPDEVVLAGDLNSSPGDWTTTWPDPTPNGLAYAVFASYGFSDTWTLANGSDPGLTCCFGERLDDSDSSGFAWRYDHVLTWPAVDAAGSARTGLDGDNRSAGGLWPSDHAGVVTILLP